MNLLNHFFSSKQKAYDNHRPCYPIPQYMSDKNSTQLKYAREDLQRAYNREISKPQSERNSELLYNMDRALYP